MIYQRTPKADSSLECQVGSPGSVRPDHIAKKTILALLITYFASLLSTDSGLFKDWGRLVPNIDLTTRLFPIGL